MDHRELSDWLRLALTPGIGNATARKLLAAFGLPGNIFAQPADALHQVVPQAQAIALRQLPPDLEAQVDKTWNWLQADPNADAPPAPATARSILTLADPRYPTPLLATEDPPLILYLQGAASLLGNAADAPLALGPGLAVVGSRNPTPQGLQNAREFARSLAQAGLIVVSGLALGVDGAAHEGALAARRNGAARPSTVAVVGTGLDRVYPKAHHALARRIACDGLLVSEYPIGTPPIPANFPRRNRIIAALSLGTLVVEATLRSGSLITARLAAELGKEVFAIPGSIHAPQSRGCHALIRQGAKLVESAQDILEELRLGVPPPDTNTAAAAEAKPARAPGPNHALLLALGFDPVSLDALLARTGLPTASLQAQLMELELSGDVGRLPGGLFQRMARS